MNRPTSYRLRALAGVAAGALTVSGLAAVAAAPALAAPATGPASTSTVAYNSIPDTLPPSYASLGYEATSTPEFGDEVQLASGTARAITGVTVGLTDWACESDYTGTQDAWTAAPSGTPCVTTQGATYTHPITVNLYDVDATTTPATLGKPIASVTQTVTIPYRPSADATCADPTAWKDPTSGSCQHGYAFNASFDFSALHPVVSDKLIVTVAYNTTDNGVAPTHVPGPYDSLNVSLSDTAPAVGTDVQADEMFWNTSYAGFYADNGAAGTGTLRADDGWDGYHGLSLKITTDDSVVPSATASVTVGEKDVLPTETQDSYTSWHDGTDNGNYSVHPDGLHLGDGAASTIIKGTDVANSEVTQSALRALPLKARVSVVSGSPTLQVPIFFGADATHLTFTTLVSSALPVGTDSVGIDDSWTTSHSFGPFTAFGSYSLSDLLAYVFSHNDHVLLAGFGVQANSLAVVSNVTWGTTSFTFDQPETSACTTTSTVTGPTNLASNGWTFGESRSDGFNVFTSAGLHVFTGTTTGSPDPRKAAGYLATNFALADAGVPALHYATAPTGAAPSIQLRVDFDNNGTFDGTLVGEAVYGGSDYWTPDSSAQFVKDGAPSHSGGYGSSNHGTLDQWLISFPNARVVQIGYSLGSGVTGSSVISSITAGCVTYTFAQASVPSPTSTVHVSDTGIRPNEATYPGWHDGYNTTGPRAYSVKSDGLHLGDGSHSQILNGFSAQQTTGIESAITSTSLSVVSGSVSLQFPVNYGSNNQFTTLLQPGLTAGSHGVSVTDLWQSSRDVTSNTGSVLLPAFTPVPLADLLALLGSVPGTVKLDGYAIQADTSAVVSTINSQGVKTIFSPAAFPATTGTVTVHDTDIAPAETADTYQQWHEGYANSTPAYSTDGDALELGIGAHSQIIKGLAASAAPFSITAKLLETAKVTVTAGSVTYQVPVYYGSSSTFTTLHSDSLTTGTHAFDLTSLWASSKPVGSIAAGQLVPLGDLLDALGTAQVLAFGVQADTDATVSAIWWNGTKYDFAHSTQAARLAGSDRYGTSVAISQSGFEPGVSRIYLAVGTGYADALSAAPAAAKFNAPLLLTQSDSLPDAVKAEIVRLHPASIVVIGGTSVVNTTVIQELKALSFTPTVTRIGGADRYATSRLIATKTFGSATTAYIATGESFSDALAAGPAAAHFGGPVILVPGSSTSVDAATLATLTALHVSNVRIAGGQNAVSSAIAIQLAATFHVTRTAGADRYATAVAINAAEFSSAHTVYLATGANFADALGGAALAGSQGAPLFVTQTGCLPTEVIDAVTALDPHEVVLLGGTSALDLDVQNLMACPTP